MELATATGTAVALTVAIVQMLKTMVPNRQLLPILALIVGVASVTLVNQDFTANGVLEGVIAGLTAMGLWTGTKVAIGADQ